jgi:hypothetical protein
MNSVSIMIRAKLDGKYPYLPVPISNRGIKPGIALVGGQEVKVKGSYYLRFTQDEQASVEAPFFVSFGTLFWRISLTARKVKPSTITDDKKFSLV